MIDFPENWCKYPVTVSHFISAAYIFSSH